MPKNRYFLNRPNKKGLYDPDFERDSCGVGLVANVKGVPSREIMDNAYLINSRMDHRGVVALKKILEMVLVFS